MNIIEHLLSCVGEEGSEIAQDVSKCLRFGLDDVNVLTPGGPTNRERLVNELNDLMGVCRLLVEKNIIPANWQNAEKQAEKRDKVKTFMQYSHSVGALNLEEELK
jgi:hypothetical protein